MWSVCVLEMMNEAKHFYLLKPPVCGMRGACAYAAIGLFGCPSIC